MNQSYQNTIKFILCSLFSFWMLRTSAEVIYTNPTDIELHSPGDEFELDLNQDGRMDFGFIYDTITNADFGVFVQFANVNTTGYDGAVSGFFEEQAQNYLAFAIDEGATITETDSFRSADPLNLGSRIESFDINGGQFINAGEKFLHVKIENGVNKFGWIRLEVDSAARITIKDYAFENLTDKGLFAGATESAVQVGTATDFEIVEDQENSSATVSFSLAFDKTGITNFKRFIVPANQINSFTVSAAQQNNNHVAIARGQTSYSEEITTATTDFNNNPIGFNIPYKVVVLTTANGVEAIDDALSVPSDNFIIVPEAEVRFVDIVPDAVVREPGDFISLDITGDSISDLFFIHDTFTNTDFGVFVRLADVVPGTGVEVRSEFNSQGENFDALAFDENDKIGRADDWKTDAGNLGVRVGNGEFYSGQFIQNGSKFLPTRYVEDGELYYGWIRLTVTDSAHIILQDFAFEKNPREGILAGQLTSGLDLQPVSRPIIDFLGSNGNLSASISPRTDAELGVESYRVCIVPAGLAADFDVEQSLNLTANQYHTISVQAGNIQQFDLFKTRNDIEGNQLIKSASYKVFVLSMADCVFAFKDVLSQGSTSFEFSEITSIDEINPNQLEVFNDGLQLTLTVKDHTLIGGSKERNAASFEIINIQGQTIVKQPLKTNNVVELPQSGVYFIITRSGNDIKQLKYSVVE